MDVLHMNSTNLELTISVPGFSSSPLTRDHQGGYGWRDLDMNRIPINVDFELDEEEESSNGGSGGPPRKKLRLSKEQSRLLEESFRQNHTLNPKQKEALAIELKLKPRQVEVWFQNRRARSKLKQTEVECEYLKRWFSSLTEQNRRLQKEVEELRAMKVSPATVISPESCTPLPASTLSMCPRCERVTTTTTTTTTPNMGSTNKIGVVGSLASKGGAPPLQSRQYSAAC